ncbi:MAG: carbohydrate ABC transporter permease [Elusimicrobiota bacterium]
MNKNLFRVIAAAAFIALVWPFGWQVITSLKAPAEIFSDKLTFIPENIYLQNYAGVFDSGPPFGLYLVNSAVIAGTATFLCLLFGSLCGYALARLPMKGKNLILALMLGVAMFPQVAVLSPLFLTLRSMGLLNTHIGLALVYTSFGLPLAVWLLTNFFRELPSELEEAALVDGCTPLSVLCKIVLPVAYPGLFSAAILVFIYCWNEFLFALVFNTSLNMRTVTVGITMFPGMYETPWGTLFAAATTVTVPLIILVFIFQRRIVSGLTAGAIK